MARYKSPKYVKDMTDEAESVDKLWEQSIYGNSEEVHDASSLKVSKPNKWLVFANTGSHMTQAMILFDEFDKDNVVIDYCALSDTKLDKYYYTYTVDRIGKKICSIGYSLCGKLIIMVYMKRLIWALKSIITSKRNNFLFIGSKNSFIVLLLTKLFKRNLKRCVWVEPMENGYELSSYGKMAKSLCDTVVLQSVSYAEKDYGKIKHIGNCFLIEPPALKYKI